LLVDLIADVTDDAAAYRLADTQMAPERIWDSRPWTSGAPGLHGVPGSTEIRLVNLTIDATSAGYVSVAADGTSSLNARPGHAVAAQALLPATDDAVWNLAAQAHGHLVVDTLARFVGGSMIAAPRFTGPQALLADSRLTTTDGTLNGLRSVAMRDADGFSGKQTLVLDSGRAAMWGKECAPAVPATCQLQLYAHRSVHGAPFLRLPDVADGTELTVTFAGGGHLRFRKVGQLLGTIGGIVPAINASPLPHDLVTMQCACADGSPGCEDNRWAELWERA
jgi:hypothetical protein